MAGKKEKIGFSLGGFDASHYRRTEAYARAVDAIYLKAVEEFAKVAAGISVNPDKPFAFSDYPGAKAIAQNIVTELSSKMKSVILKGTRAEWLYACEKNDAFLGSIMDTTKIPANMLAKYQDRNLDALSGFQKRKTDGFDLSRRIWNYAGQMKEQMELGIDVAIGQGKPAANLSRELKQYLQDPDKLFRRVRDKRGNLHLSKNAKAFNPGQGKYRSSYKNAMRLTRSEINMAYRQSDRLRWRQLDFVIGFEIKLSNNHTTIDPKTGQPVPFVDICDKLAGKYPKSFVFKGWHPQCRCLIVPIMEDFYSKGRSDDRVNRLKAALKGTEYKKYVSKELVTDVPDNFKQWAADNMERSQGWKSQPYFVRDNFVGGNIKGGLKMGTIANAGISGQINTQVAKDMGTIPDPMAMFTGKISGSKTLPQIVKTTEAELLRLGQATKVTITSGDIDVETAKAFSKAIVSLVNEYKLEIPLTVLEAKQGAEYGYMAYVKENGSTAKYYNEMRGKKIRVGGKYDNERLKDKAGFKSLCDEDKAQISTLTHEFAHVLWTESDKTQSSNAFYGELVKIRGNYREEIRKRFQNGEDVSDIYLGEYASSRDISEFMAESFQEYKNKKTPSKYAKLVGALIDKYYLKSL